MFNLVSAIASPSRTALYTSKALNFVSLEGIIEAKVLQFIFNELFTWKSNSHGI